MAHMHASPHHCVRMWWEGPTGPLGVGWCACDMTHIINHVHAHLVGLGGVFVSVCVCERPDMNTLCPPHRKE